MNFISLFKIKTKKFYLSVIFLSLISTAMNLGILFIIGAVIRGKNISMLGGHLCIAFAALIVVSFACTVFFQNKMTALTNNIIFDLEISIIEKVRDASYESFERLGKEKIYAIIGDAWLLGRIPETMISFLNSAVSILCSLSYLFWISPMGGGTMSFFIALLLLGYLYRNKSIILELKAVRALQDTYYYYLRELLDGFKQIKISNKRNNNLFHKFILKNRFLSKKSNISASKRYVINQLSGAYSWYVLIGIIIFLLPFLFKLNVIQITAFITTTLFIMGPVSTIVSLIPYFSRVNISIDRINETYSILNISQANKAVIESKPQQFESIRFENLTFKYEKDSSSFEMNLPELSIYNGQTVFLTGGNGSGKTTFINVFTGLYSPSSGRVYLNNNEVSWDEFKEFNNQMAVIYTDHHLFNENYDEHDLSENSPSLNDLKNVINVKDILKFDIEKNYLNTKLSKGQQKRIALLLALMEDKPIIVLDEWAAEQDPSNRKSFYTEWIFKIKEMNKTLIIISHDDDSFNMADRVIRFKYGKVFSDINQMCDL